jgi:hypothetical protein
LSETQQRINLEERASRHSSVRPTAGRERSRRKAVIGMPHLDGSFVVLAFLFVLLLLLTEPKPRRVVLRLVRPASNWAATHWKKAEDSDREENELWLIERRQKLCDDLRRVERLVATDSWMSATRQRANRIAYNQLVYDLRHTPEVSPTTFQTFSPWDESAIDPRWTRLINNGASQKPPTVEVLEIGWGRRR